jgi:hypothetical protein
MYNLMINEYIPIIEDGIELDLERKGFPGKLTFNVVKDNKLDFAEGDPVSFFSDDSKAFHGFVFTKGRNKNGIIKVTAYDQMRYLKNKDTYIYAGKTASEVINMIASDFELEVGDIVDTSYKIPSRIEDNKTLFDIIQTALEITLQNRNRMYVLYDDFGKLTLKDIESMKLDVLINDMTGENFDYASTIDSETYNRIKLMYNNEEDGVRETFMAQDGSNIGAWGVLQHFETIDGNVNGQVMADSLLSLYNSKARRLTINNAYGDIRVRPGCLIPVNLDLGDIVVNNYMMVEKAKHIFKKDEHTMNLTLRGGGFIS